LDPIITDWLTRPGGLAPQLRGLRTAAGLVGTDLADRAGWNQSKVSRIENGKQLPSETDIRTWAAACGAGDTVGAELLELLGDVQAVHLDWKRRTRHGQTAVQASYNELVQSSKAIRHFETAVVPGLLQTAEYARCIAIEAASLQGTDDDPDQVVAMKMQRQQFLYDPTKQYEFLMAEPVLRWLPCPPNVMRAQLDRLQTVIGLPNVRLGIIPLGVQLDTLPQNNFVLYDDIAKVETFVGESSHTGDQAAFYGVILERLWAVAVEGDAARRLIIRAADELPPT
jgi:transcriptional regulator with XRE-family HTH domain